MRGIRTSLFYFMEVIQIAFINTHFSYDGVTSEDMGIYLVKMSTGLMESQFFGDRQLKYDVVAGSRTPYYYSDEVSPFKVTLQLSPLDGEWTDEFKNKITRWLNNGKFNEFFSVDSTERLYHLSYIGSPSLNITGLNQGYLEIEFQNIDCYVRSPVEMRIFDLSTITVPTTIELTNLGTETTLPDVFIQKVNVGGTVSIKNLSNGGITSTLSNLAVNETLTMDGENRTLDTSNPNLFRYDDFNKTYVSIVYGVNQLEVTGKCILTFKFRHLFLSQ